jgi:hypothetical protein
MNPVHRDDLLFEALQNILLSHPEVGLSGASLLHFLPLSC